MNINRNFSTLVGAGLALLLAGPVGAVTINQGLAPGLNTIEDQDREAFFDANNDGVLSIGDVFVGFVRMDDFIPSVGAASSSDNQVYGVISNQIVGAGPGGEIIMGATTVAGLTLAELTGDANTAGGMFAIYDSGAPYGNNLIQDSAPAATGMDDNIDYIVDNGTLRLVAGVTAANNFLTVVNNAGFGLGSSTAGLAIAPVSITLGNFSGGLSVLYNNTNYTYNNTVLANGPLNPFTLSQIAIANGSIRGGVGDSQASIFTDGSSYGVTQCAGGIDVSQICGFVTDADFFVDVTPIPEPATLTLFGGALLGLGFMRRRKTNS